MNNITTRQKQIVKKMQEGWMLFTGISEANGRQYYGVTLGFENDYFNVTVFSNLIQKGLVHQLGAPSYEYVLTSLGESI